MYSEHKIQIKKYVLNDDFLKGLGFEGLNDPASNYKTYRHKEASLRLVYDFGAISVETYAWNEKKEVYELGQELLTEFEPQSDDDLIFVLCRLSQVKSRIKFANEQF